MRSSHRAPSARVWANYTISYVNGNLTVTPAALTITANSTTKTYGQTVTFAGTAFTTSGLVNSDSVASVSLSSTGAAATATVAGSPYAIIASGAVGSGLGNYTISYVNGSLTVSAGAADHHRQQHDQDLRADRDLRRHRVHDQRPGQQRLGDQREPEQHGRGGDRAGGWLALRHHRVGRRRLRSGELHDQLC